MNDAGSMAGAKRNWNWRIWIGFLLTLVAVGSYVAIFAYFPVTRDVPWVSYLLFLVALGLLVIGLRRAFGQPAAYRGKIAGPILAMLSLVVMASFTYGILYGSKHLPPSNEAPKVGDKAPEFSLPDTHGKTTTLAELLSSPFGSTGKAPKAVLLVFYRGYW